MAQRILIRREHGQKVSSSRMRRLTEADREGGKAGDRGGADDGAVQRSAKGAESKHDVCGGGVEGWRQR